MDTSAFLDKSVLLGYCFITDTHGNKCEEYISESGNEFYISNEVRKAFDRNKSRIVRDHTKAIQRHVQSLTKSKYTGEVGPAELKSINQSLVPKSNCAWRYLSDYYSNKQLSSIYEIKNELRDLARDIEQLAEERKEAFEEMVLEWNRVDDHQTVQEALQEVKDSGEEDFWICIDAHDLACNVEGETELATADVKDFKNNGRENLILGNTELDRIRPLAVTVRQR